MILIKEIDIKKTAIVFFSTFIYVVCQMLLTKIITKEGCLMICFNLKSIMFYIKF